MQRSPDGRWNRYETVLGVGAFKWVYLGLDTQEGKEVAWNTIKLGCLSANDKARVQAEVALLTRLKHKHILVMYDTWVDEEAGELYLITSRMANTLKEHVAKLHPLQPTVVKKYCRQILSALAYLHAGVADSPDGEKKPIIHRDLKCDNIFIDGPTGDVKVGDFGLAEFFDKGIGDDCKQVPGTMEGTMGFIAPELLQEQPYTERVDIYAFGMCVLEMATNEYPFAECGNKLMTLLEKTSKGLPPEALSRMEDPDLKKLIEQCLLPAEQRPSAKELLENTYYPLNDDFRLEVAARLSASMDMMIRISLKITLRGRIKTIQFDYDISKDTPTSLVREIQADVLKDEKNVGDLENEMIAKMTEAVKPAIKKLRQRQLTELLQKLELEMSLMDSFAKEEITIVDLTLLQEADWDRLGIPLGPRRRIQQYLSVVPVPGPAGLSMRENSSFAPSSPGGPSDNAGPAIVEVHAGTTPIHNKGAPPSLSVDEGGSFTSVVHSPPSKSYSLASPRKNPFANNAHSNSSNAIHTSTSSSNLANANTTATTTSSSTATTNTANTPPTEDDINARLKNTSLSSLSGGPPPPPKKPIAA